MKVFNGNLSMILNNIWKIVLMLALLGSIMVNVSSKASKTKVSALEVNVEVLKSQNKNINKKLDGFDKRFDRTDKKLDYLLKIVLSSK